MRAVATALQPSTVSHSRPPARARRAARCPARCTDATIAFPGRPAYVGGSSRAAGHFAARPAADGEAQRRYSTRRDGEPREPGESRSGSASVTNHADSGGSGRASGTAGSRAHTRRARARARRQFPARSPHRIVEPAAGAGGVRRRSSPSGPSGDPDGPEGIRKRSCGGGVHAEQVVSRPHERLRLARVVGERRHQMDLSRPRADVPGRTRARRHPTQPRETPATVGFRRDCPPVRGSRGGSILCTART